MKLSKEKAWVECRRMWNWIADKVRERGGTVALEDVRKLKQEWLNANGYTYKLYNDCFFCDYAGTHKTVFDNNAACSTCPGVEVDPLFDCEDFREDEIYMLSWDKDPIEFSEYINKLARMRKR